MQVQELEIENAASREAVNAAWHNVPSALYALNYELEELKEQLTSKKSKSDPDAIKKGLETISFYVDVAQAELDLAQLLLDQGDPVIRLTDVRVDLGVLLKGFQARRNKGREVYNKLHLDIALKTLENVPEDLKVARGVIISAVSNFLKNSMKFAPPHSTIDVNVEYTATDPRQGTLLVSVSDQGMGMTTDELARVFDKGDTIGLDNLQIRWRKGSGKGLKTVAAFVSAAGGTYGAESAGPGQGATFWIRVPAHPAP